MLCETQFILLKLLTEKKCKKNPNTKKKFTTKLNKKRSFMNDIVMINFVELFFPPLPKLPIQ